MRAQRHSANSCAGDHNTSHILGKGTGWWNAVRAASPLYMACVTLRVLGRTCIPGFSSHLIVSPRHCPRWPAQTRCICSTLTCSPIEQCGSLHRSRAHDHQMRLRYTPGWRHGAFKRGDMRKRRGMKCKSMKWCTTVVGLEWRPHRQSRYPRSRMPQCGALHRFSASPRKSPRT